MTQKQIKIKTSVYELLNSMKREDESFSEVIRRLIVENKSMRTHIEELKIDKNNLMKIAMQTPDSISFPRIAHYVIFALIEVLKDNSSDELKLINLKTYLKPSLEKNPDEVLKHIEEFKREYNVKSNVLNELSSWIRETYHV